MPKKIEFDENELGALCRLVATIKDCADFFGCSHDTIERRVREWGYDGYASFKDAYFVETRFKLKRTLLQRAETSDNALIFALKNMCGFTDRVESSASEETLKNLRSFIVEKYRAEEDKAISEAV